MDIKIEDIGLSVRAYNCLRRAGVKTVDEIANIDLNHIRNCGVGTIKEIQDKLRLIQETWYDDLDLEYMKKDYVDTLQLSARSKNVLKNLKVTNASELLSLELYDLYGARNAGLNTVNEITEYININREALINQYFNDEDNNFGLLLNHDIQLSGNTNINDLPISTKLKKTLRDNNINTIEQFITQNIQVDPSIEKQYNAVYDYFYNLVYNSMEEFDIAEELNKMFVHIPFDAYKFEKGELYEVNEIVNETLYNFNKFNTYEKINIKLFLHWISLFKIKNIRSYFIEKLNLDEKEVDVISKRNYKTLEEIGMEHRITRERARQIESKAVRKIKHWYHNIPFRFLNPKKIYYMSQCSQFELLMLYIDSVTEKKYIFVQNGIEKYFLPDYYVEYIRNFINNNKETLDYFGYIEFNEEYYLESFIKAIEYLGYNYHNNYISEKITKRAQVKYAMRYINKTISLSNQEDTNLVIQVVKYIFGTQIESIRAVEALINDSGIRIGPGTYVADDIVIPLTKDLLNDIKTYVREKKIINARDLFVKFGEELNKHNLKNEVILYRYLKECLGKELCFHGVSAVISCDESLSSWGDVVIKTIKETNKPISKHDFMLKYSITEAVYNNLATNFNDIIVWGTKELYLKSMIKVPKDIITKLTEEIYQKQIMSFDEIKNNIKKYDNMLLKNNNVNNNETLYYFLVNVFGDDIIIDKKYEEVRYKNKRNKIISEEYMETEELTI